MLLKFAYDGTKFYGYQRQKNLRTVEGEILRVIREHGIAESIKSASRTDRGVSALGNVIRVDTDKKPRDVIGILNANLKDIFFHSYALEDVNPRFAKMRWYRYHLPRIYSVEKLEEASQIFVGEHDFRNFTRAKKNTVLKIDDIRIREMDIFIVIDFYAQYYLWNLIRRIVAAMISYASGQEFGDEVFRKRINFGLAPPEPLILMDVIYPFEFRGVAVKRKTLEKFFTKFAPSLVYLYLSGRNQI